MALLKIVHHPDPVLKKVAAPVTDFDAGLRRLAEDMAETMYAAPGVGLAAPQVGVSKRLIVLDCSPKDEKQLVVAVNPKIVFGEGESCEEEGCLSVPNYYAKVERKARVQVQYQDLEGVEQLVEVEGLWSTCFQHEIDHLDGILFVDRLSPLKKNIFRKKYKKILEQLEEQL
ncbi:peptide deformylase [Geothermobacter hydrogeniphilus]|uniref:Peptide deformylase n=1 Tax=Geothermobacter hydrogeniphilus TaxID=1969733 RepID=A0A2K2HEI9_9BACT|nr:peptide deformylase [Geothermobacter hydrogeniphilus]PNU21706.1 peptide deformylase [Geothermobacter hydrogeniphilus]